MSDLRVTSSTAGLTVAAAGLALAAGLTGSPVVLTAVLAVVVLGLLTLLPTNALVGLLVLSTFVTRYGIDIGGLTLRPEHVAGGLLAVALLRRGVPGDADRRHRVLRNTLVVYVLYSTVITVLFAPSPASSATVLLWFAADCLILSALLRVPGATRTLVRQGTVLAVLQAVLGLLLWVVANLGGPAWNVQADVAYGGLAAYGLSYEANIFAGITCVWAVIALASPRAWVAPWVRAALLVLAPLVALASHTRTAVLALVAGLLVLLLSRTSGESRRKAVGALVGMAVVVPLALLAGVPGTTEIADKFARLVDPTSPNAQLRLDATAVALDDLGMPSVLAGLGTNSYGQRHIRQSFDGQLVPDYLGNLPLQVLYDTGLVGALVLITGLLLAGRGRRYPGRGTAVLATLLVVSLGTSFFWFAGMWIFVLIGCDDLAEAVPGQDQPPLGPPRTATAPGLRARG